MWMQLGLKLGRQSEEGRVEAERSTEGAVRIRHFALLLVLGVLGPPPIPLSQSLPAGLVGTWRLVSYEVSRPNGEVLFPYGRNAVGVITYDPAGRMAVQIMKPDRPKCERGKCTVAEKVAAFDGYVAYFGTYAVDARNSTVTHHPEGSLGTWRVGVPQRRSMQLDGDRLLLTASFSEGGEERRAQIRWRRVDHFKP
jgi:hypothetical protein